MKLALIYGNKADKIALTIKKIKDNIDIDSFKGIPDFIDYSIKRQTMYDRVLMPSTCVTEDVLMDLKQFWSSNLHNTSIVLLCKDGADERLGTFFAKNFVSPNVCAMFVDASKNNSSALSDAVLMSMQQLNTTYGKLNTINVQEDDEEFELKPNTPQVIETPNNISKDNSNNVDMNQQVQSSMNTQEVKNDKGKKKEKKGLFGKKNKGEVNNQQNNIPNNGMQPNMPNNGMNHMSNGRPNNMPNGMQNNRPNNGMPNGMNNMPNNGMPNGMNNMPNNGMPNGMNNMPNNGMPNGMNNMPNNGMPNGMNNMPNNGMQNGMNNMPNNMQQNNQQKVNEKKGLFGKKKDKGNNQNNMPNGMQNNMPNNMQPNMTNNMQPNMQNGMNNIPNGMQNNMPNNMQPNMQNGMNNMPNGTQNNMQNCRPNNMSNNIMQNGNQNNMPNASGEQNNFSQQNPYTQKSSSQHVSLGHSSSNDLEEEFNEPTFNPVDTFDTPSQDSMPEQDIMQHIEKTEIQQEVNIEDTNNFGSNSVIEEQKNNEVDDDFNDTIILSDDGFSKEFNTPNNSVSISEVSDDTSDMIIGEEENAYRKQNETPKVIYKDREVVREVIRDSGGSGGIVDSILRGHNPHVLVVTGDRGTGITSTCLSLASFFSKKIPVLYFDCDTKNHGVLSYINYEEFRNFENTKMNGTKICRNMNAFANCVCKFDNNFDLLSCDYSVDVTEEELKSTSETVAEKVNDYGIVIVDCPVENLHCIPDLVSSANTILCVDASKRGFMNMLCSLESSPLPLRFKKTLLNKGIMFLTKYNKDIDVKRIVAYVREIYEPDLINWLEMSSAPFNGKVEMKLLNRVFSK